LTITSFGTTSTAPVVVGTPTTLAATVAGGFGPYTYKFWVHNGSAWSVGQDWSSVSTFDWIPTAGATFSFQVWVKNAGSTSDVDAWRNFGPLTTSAVK
jgi:hypothetical protein